MSPLFLGRQQTQLHPGQLIGSTTYRMAIFLSENYHFNDGASRSIRDNQQIPWPYFWWLGEGKDDEGGIIEPTLRLFCGLITAFVFVKPLSLPCPSLLHEWKVGDESKNQICKQRLGQNQELEKGWPPQKQTQAKKKNEWRRREEDGWGGHNGVCHLHSGQLLSMKNW